MRTTRRDLASMSAPPTIRSTPSTSPPLAAAGFVMFLVLFLANNPYFGIAAQKWPWEVFRMTDDPLARVTFVMWCLTGLYALGSSFFERSPARSTILLCLCTPLLAASAAEGAAFPIVRHHMGELVVLILMSAALWLTGRSRAGRALGLMGGLVFFWMLAITNDPDLLRSRLWVLGNELGLLFQGETVRPKEPHYIWWQLIPYTMVAFAALLAITQSFVRVRWVSRVAWIILLVALFFPAGVHLVVAPRVSTDAFASALFTALVHAGIAILLLATFAITDAAQGHEQLDQEETA